MGKIVTFERKRSKTNRLRKKLSHKRERQEAKKVIEEELENAGAL